MLQTSWIVDLGVFSQTFMLQRCMLHGLIFVLVLTLVLKFDFDFVFGDDRLLVFVIADGGEPTASVIGRQRRNDNNHFVHVRYQSVHAES